MAANQTWSAEFPFQSRITSLATNTTLGTATEQDFTDIDVRLPENVVIRHAYVQLDFADEFAAAADIDGVRGGIQIDAVAFSDTDVSMNTVDTGDHARFRGTFDVTSYFQTNYVTDGQGAAVGFRTRVATESAQNVNGVAAKLVITYAFDAADSTFYLDGTEQEVVGGFVKTVRIPIQSHHTSISTSYVEAGTVSGAYDAPANQIPNLEDLLTDRVNITAGNMKGVLAIWMEIDAQSLGSGTDLLMTCRFDGATDVARYNVENSSLATNVTYFDRVTLGGSSLSSVDHTLATNAAAAFEAKSSSATTFQHVGGWLCVTYIVNPSQTRAFNSVMVPLDNGRSDVSNGHSHLTGHRDYYNAMINVQEPGPIVMRQSAVSLAGQINNTTKTIGFPGVGVMERAFVGVSSAIRDGAAPVVARFDHADPTDATTPSFGTFALMRGFNQLSVQSYATVSTTNGTMWGGYAVFNYHSGVAVNESNAAAPSRHARSLVFPVIPTLSEVSGAVISVVSPTAPTLVEDYTIIGAMARVIEYMPGQGAGGYLGAKRVAGEGPGGGWERSTIGQAGNAAENGPKEYFLANTDWWREHPGSSEGVDYLDSARLDVETARDWQLYNTILSVRSASLVVTIHSITYPLAGTYNVNDVGVTGTGLAPSGGYGVEVTWRDLHGTRGGMLRRNLAVTAGAWSTTVYDDTVLYTVSGRGAGGINTASKTGFIQRNKGNTETPKVVGVGAYSANTATFTLTAGEHRWGDLIVLFTESTNGSAVPTPTGFTIATGAPQEGTAARLSAFVGQATSEADQYNEIAAPSIAAAGFTNHASGYFVVVRGANMDDLFFGGTVASATSAIDAGTGGTAATSTSLSVAGATSTVDNCLVLVAYAGDVDTVAGTDQTLNTWANSALDSLRGVAGNSTAAGDGGNISIARGYKHTAGAIGATSATLSNTSTHCKLCMAIKPQVWPTTTFDLVANDGGGGGARPVGSRLVRRIA